MSSNIFFAHVGLELGAGALPGVRAPVRLLRAGRHRSVRSCAAGDHQLRERPRWTVTAGRSATTSSSPARRSGRARRRSPRCRWRSWLPRSPATGSCRTRTSCATSARMPTGDAPSDEILETFGSGGGTRVVSSEAAAATRAAMVDAVNGPLGRLYAGQGDITLYGISNARSAGQDRHCPARRRAGAALVVHRLCARRGRCDAPDRDRGAGRERRLGLRTGGADRRSGDGRMAAPVRGRVNPFVTRWGIV